MKLYAAGAQCLARGALDLHRFLIRREACEHPSSLPPLRSATSGRACAPCCGRMGEVPCTLPALFALAPVSFAPVTTYRARRCCSSHLRQGSSHLGARQSSGALNISRASVARLYVNYLEDGTQVIRDRYGGLISRQGSVADGYQALQASDPAGRLLAAVEALDGLMRAAAESR